MVEASLPFQHYRHYSPYHQRPLIASIVVLFLGTLLLFDNFRLSTAGGRRIGTGGSGGPSLHAPTVNLNRKRPQRNSSLDVSKSEIFFGPRRAYLLLLLPPQCFQTTTVAPSTSTTRSPANVPYYYYGNRPYGGGGGGGGGGGYAYYNAPGRPKTGRKPGKKRFSQMRGKPANAGMRRRKIWHRRRRRPGAAGGNRNGNRQILPGGRLNPGWPIPKTHRVNRSSEKQSVLGAIIKAIQMLLSKSVYILKRTATKLAPIEKQK